MYLNVKQAGHKSWYAGRPWTHIHICRSGQNDLPSHKDKVGVSRKTDGNPIEEIQMNRFDETRRVPPSSFTIFSSTTLNNGQKNISFQSEWG
jgi:hypothetical protein